MKNVIKLFIFSTSFLFVHSTLAKNLCLSEETEVMACQLDEAKKRNISICYDKKNDEAFYRIGKDSSNLEMIKKFTGNDPLLRWLDSSYNTSFGFQNGSYFYKVDIPEEMPGRLSSVTVIQKNKKDNSIKFCTSNSFGEKKQNSRAILEVDNEVAKGSNGNVLFPIMFYENQKEKLIKAQKNRVRYDKINFINQNFESKCIENLSLNSCKEKIDIKKFLYHKKSALELVPKLIVTNEHYKDFIFMNIDGDLYTIASNPIDLDSGSTVNYYDFIRLRGDDFYTVQLGTWFEITKDKKLKYKDIYDNKIKNIPLN